MAQSVKPSTLDIGLGHDLMISEFGPHFGLCAYRASPLGSLSLPLSLPLSLSQRKKKKETSGLKRASIHQGFCGRGKQMQPSWVPLAQVFHHVVLRLSVETAVFSRIDMIGKVCF